MRRFALYGPSTLVLITAAMTLLAGPTAIRQIQAARTAATVTLAQNRLDDNSSILREMNRAIRDVADAVEPSVVYIEANTFSANRGPRNSTGSGWVYDQAGHIVTNAHVVRDAARIEVQFQDYRVRDAKLVGIDRLTDVAVLKVDADPTLLTPARRASGAPLHQGDMVFAFGSPFSLKFSMSQGIVSGLGRDARASGGDRYTNFIQTDAAVNPGNSGGPLVDVQGRVIGMNTAIIADASRLESGEGQTYGVSGGIGFAIPLETLESVVDQLIDRGIVVRGFLGVQLRPFDASAARTIGYDLGPAVTITGIEDGLAADRAGLEPGDIIMAVNGNRTPTLPVLRAAISNSSPNEVVRLRIWRDGDQREIDVTLMGAVESPEGSLQLVPKEMLEKDGLSIDDIRRQHEK